MPKGITDLCDAFGIFNVLLQKNTGYDIIEKNQKYQGEIMPLTIAICDDNEDQI